MNKPVQISLLFFSLSFVLIARAIAQPDTASITGTFNQKKFRTVIISEALIYSGVMVGLNELWYKDYPRSGFHFFNDNKEWLQMDKAGHLVTSYYVGYAGMAAMWWSGVERRKAIWYGGSLGFIFLTTIEILDGYSSAWGASTGDLVANSAGSALLIGQELLWKEQRMLLKFSFHTTMFPSYNSSLLGRNFSEQLLKDYNGQTYWLSANIRSFIKNKDSRFPGWLNVAVGYGAEGMIGGKNNPALDEEGNVIPNFKRYRQYYLSLDLDLTRIKTRSKFANLLLRGFGFIKIPFPALEYNSVNHFRFHPFYF